jgi:hypothetical protein
VGAFESWCDGHSLKLDFKNFQFSKLSKKVFCVFLGEKEVLLIENLVFCRACACASIGEK